MTRDLKMCSTCRQETRADEMESIHIFATFPPKHRVQLHCIPCLQKRGSLCVVHRHPHWLIALEEKPDKEVLFVTRGACPLCAIEEANAVQTDVANTLLEELMVTFPEQSPEYQDMHKEFAKLTNTNISPRTQILATLIIVAVCLGYDSVLTMLEEAQSKLSGAGTA
jgi:hypothetical protein